MSVPATMVTKKSTKTRRRLQVQSEEMLRVREEIAILSQGFQSQARQIAQLKSDLLQEKNFNKRQAERIEQLEFATERQVISLAHSVFRAEFESAQFPSVEKELTVIEAQLAGQRPALNDKAVIVYDRLLSERKAQIESAQQAFQAAFDAFPALERIAAIQAQLQDSARRPVLAPGVARRYCQLLEQANDTQAAEQAFASYRFAALDAYPSIALRLARVETLLRLLPVPTQFPDLTSRQKAIFERLLKEEQTNLRTMQLRFESNGFNDPIKFARNDARLVEVQRQQAPAVASARALPATQEQIYSRLLAEALAEFNQIETEAQKRYQDKQFEPIADLRARAKKIHEELITGMTLLGLGHYQQEAYARRLRIALSRVQANIERAEQAVLAHQFTQYSSNRYRCLEAITLAQSNFTSAGFMLQEGEQRQFYQFLLAEERARTEAAMRSGRTSEEIREYRRRRNI